MAVIAAVVTAEFATPNRRPWTWVAVGAAPGKDITVGALDNGEDVTGALVCHVFVLTCSFSLFCSCWKLTRLIDWDKGSVKGDFVEVARSALRMMYWSVFFFLNWDDLIGFECRSMSGKDRGFIDLSDYPSHLSLLMSSQMKRVRLAQMFLQTALSKTQVVCTTVGDSQIWILASKNSKQLKLARIWIDAVDIHWPQWPFLLFGVDSSSLCDTEQWI